MNRFHEEGSSLTLKSGSGMGCALGIFFAVGIGMMLGGLGLIGIMLWDTWQWDLVPIAAFLTLMGLLFFLAALRNASRSYRSWIVFDNSTQKVTYHTGNPARGIVFPYGEIRGFNGYRRYESSTSSSGTSRRVAVYSLYAQKIDGSLFWITNPGSGKALEEMGGRVATFTGHGYDGTGAEAGAQPATKEYVFRKTALASSLGPWVESSMEGQGRSYRLKTPRNAVDTITLGIVVIFMLSISIGVPVGVASGNPWMLIPLFPVMVVPLGIIALIIFLQLRDYRLVLTREALELRLRYRFGPLDQRLGKVVKIPATALRAIRVSRYEMGYIGLGLAYASSHSVDRLSGFLANLTNLRQPLPTGEQDTRQIAVWQIEPWVPAGKGVEWRDLLVIEREIEEFYGLEKDS